MSPRLYPGDDSAPGLPAGGGIGFKPQHFADLMADADPPAFVEIHAENYMGAGGVPHAQLTALRERLPLSVHGVGLSIGGSMPIDVAHLERLARLVERYEPAAVSEHLAWCSHDGAFFGDLLPLPYTDATLARVCNHIDRVQTRLGRQIYIENPSTYVRYTEDTFSEPEFMRQMAERSGCGLLLDVNNVVVSAHNGGFHPLDYLLAFPIEHVRQLHLAGHTREVVDDGSLLIDDHGGPVAEMVWALYEHVIRIAGEMPTTIEWDTNVPAYFKLKHEAKRATLRAGAARTGRQQRIARTRAA
jgi:uncharacterized protein (UPF0276 family)